MHLVTDVLITAYLARYANVKLTCPSFRLFDVWKASRRGFTVPTVLRPNTYYSEDTY